MTDPPDRPSDSTTRYRDYDGFAWAYARHWGPDFAERIWPVIERLVLDVIPEDGAILDLCCGSGDLAMRLAGRGYRVTGLDGSAEMLRIARERAPAVTFLLDDARTFRLPGRFDAVVSIFDSLNHVLELAELAAVFRNVHASLRPAGLFLFDLNTEAGYRKRWRGDVTILEDDHAVLARVAYDRRTRVGSFDVALFRQAAGDCWRRTDVSLRQRCHDLEAVTAALAASGFPAIRTLDADREVGRRGDVGRVVVVGRKGG